MSAALDLLAVAILWSVLALWVVSCCYAIYALRNDLTEGFADLSIAISVMGGLCVIIWALWHVTASDGPLRVEVHQVEP